MVTQNAPNIRLKFSLFYALRSLVKVNVLFYSLNCVLLNVEAAGGNSAFVWDCGTIFR